MRTKIPGEDLGGDGHIVVAVMDPLDLLIPLRALARDDDRIGRARIQNRLSYRVASACRDLMDVVHVGTRRGDAPEEVVANRLRIFAPGILVGHPQDVGLARRYADRIIGMNGGKVVFDGAPDALTDADLNTIYGGKDWLQ